MIKNGQAAKPKYREQENWYFDALEYFEYWFNYYLKLQKKI